MAKIFVQIAAYRDPELPYTVEDLLAKARHPKAIRIGICNQSGPASWNHPTLQQRAIKQIRVPFRQAQGTCWARHCVQKFYDGEEFTLQLDSHHRFVPGWDRMLLDMLPETGSTKPLLTAYLPGYHGKARRVAFPAPVVGKQVFQKFDRDGVVAFRGATLTADEQQRPPRARFSSGHFIFTQGKFIEEVPYDPTLYFMGEEITLAARAYTHGYDLFHPNRCAMFHSYLRHGSRRHWDDHNKKLNAKFPSWREYHTKSVNRVHALLEGADAEPVPRPYGLGGVRSLRDFEMYAGINFKHRLVHPNTIDGMEPPSTRCWNWEWAHRPGRELQAEVKLDSRSLDRLPPAAFWYFALHDAHGLELFRADLSEPEYFSRKKRKVAVHCWSRGEPTTYTVIPYYGASGWGKRICRPLTSSNYKTILAS